MRRSSDPRPENRSRDGKRSNEAKRSPGAGTLALPEEDLAERRYSKVFVEVPEGSGSNRREIGELSQAELRSLEPRLRISVVNRLLERYVAEHGHLDLLEGGTTVPRTAGLSSRGSLVQLMVEQALRQPDVHEKSG
jgi:hypothetical protein